MYRRIKLILLALALVLLPAMGVDAAESSVEQAISILTERLDESPRDAALLTDYANLLTRTGRYDEALAAYRSSLDQDPDSLTTLYNLGLLEFELGRTRTAGRYFKRALAVDEGFARGHYGLGLVLVERERSNRAVKHFSRAFSLDPSLLDYNTNPELLFNRLATWASMRSYLDASPQRGTRLYNDPTPIVGLLLPELNLLEPASEDEAEPSEPAEDEG